jgi:hypothetical protein
MGTVLAKNANRICKHCQQKFYRRGTAVPTYCSVECMAASYSTSNHTTRKPKVVPPKGYLASQVVADRVGYTRKTIIRLAQDPNSGVNGQKCGGYWYIDLNSVNKYIDQKNREGNKHARPVIVFEPSVRGDKKKAA